MVTIHIVCSKTDQLRQGDKVLVTRSNSCSCPVAMVERYMQCMDMSPSDQHFLFRPIQHTRSGGATAAANTKVPDRLYEAWALEV